MYKIINQIRHKSTKHVSNQHKKHEKFLEQIILSKGYKKSNLKDLNLTKKKIRNCEYGNHKTATMCYVSQPCGSQSFPDFLVIDKFGDIYYVEAKSSKDDKITWNSGMPHEQAIYIFSSGEHDKQTAVMGSDLWTPEEKKLQLKIRDLIEQTYKPQNKPEHSVQYYGRHMHNDNKKVYAHPERKSRESKVYRYIGGRRSCHKC